MIPPQRFLPLRRHQDRLHLGQGARGDARRPLRLLLLPPPRRAHLGRSRRARSSSAPQPGSLSRYRFGLGITDYLLCAKCGTYVGAVMPDERPAPIGIVNVNALDIRDTFDPAPPLHVYDGEDEARRRARRRKFWMKATVIA